ncbi:MAG: hypothetical protein U1E62_05525 [Alsobacter sp.]
MEHFISQATQKANWLDWALAGAVVGFAFISMLSVLAHQSGWL